MELDKALDAVLNQSEGEDCSDFRGKKIAGIKEKLVALGVNLTELEGILTAEGNVLVSSCAGSGKSTAMTLKLIMGLVTKDYIVKKKNVSIAGVSEYEVSKKIFMGTFLRSGAKELEQSFYSWCKKLGIKHLDTTNIKFSTLHAEFYDVLKKIGVPIKIQELSDTVIKNTLTELGIRNGVTHDTSFDFNDIREIRTMISYVRNRLDQKKYEHPTMSDYDIDISTLDMLLERLKEKRNRQFEAMDFEDIQEMLYESLNKNENISKFLAKRYDIVMLDEFQDTSQIQYAILKHYFKGAEQVIAIGDDDQTIYSWRGSDVDIINKHFEEDVKPEVLNLSVNYRCKAGILKPIINSIECNAGRRNKHLVSYEDGGKVYMVTKDRWKRLLQLAEKGDEYALLSRTNYDLLIPALLLELKADVTYKIPKSVDLDKGSVRMVVSMLRLATYDMDNSFRQVFRLFVPYYKNFMVEKLLAVLSNNPDTNLFNIDLADIEASCDLLYPLISGIQATYKNNIQDGDEAARRAVLLFVFEYTVVYFKGKKSKSQYSERLCEFIDFMKYIMTDTEFGYSDKPLDYFSVMFTNVLQGALELRKTEENPQIIMSTVHEAKGKEWENVIIWNDIRGTFPVMLNSRDLHTEEYEEERRIHYIAWTRAKDRLVVFTDKEKYSPFLLEAFAGLTADTE